MEKLRNVNCNSYNIFSCVWNLIRGTCKPYNVFFEITVIRKHQQQLATVNISNECWGTDFTKNRLAIQALPYFRSSNIAYLDPKGQLIERVNISNGYSKNISLCDACKLCNVFFVITVIRKHQQQFAFLINEYKFTIR
jgi:hypothetical protein